jgi:hypothetical protein
MRGVKGSGAVTSRPSQRHVALAQGVFNLVGGLWPLLSIRTFEAVYGPKTDRWLEYTVSGLLVSIGLNQVTATDPSQLAQARRLGQAAALTLLVIDGVYVPRRTIRVTYLQDAACEVFWLLAWRRARPDSDCRDD